MMSANRTPRRAPRLALVLVLVGVAPVANAMAIVRHQLWPSLPGGRVVESVEWMSADAELIVHVIVEGAEVEHRDGPFAWTKIRVRPIERIKSIEVSGDAETGPGNQARAFDVAAWRRRPATDPQAALAPRPWWAPGTEVLLFLDRATRYDRRAAQVAGCQYVVRHHGGWLSTEPFDQAVRLDGSDGVATIAREWVNGPERIKARVRDGMLARWDERVVIDGGPTQAGEQMLVVPSGPALDRQAALWATTDNRRTVRMLGIRLLERYRSAHGERVLRLLLEDTSDAPGEVGIARGFRHPIRAAARDALSRWGVDVAAAVVDEPGDWYRPIGRGVAGAGMVGVAAVLAVGCWRGGPAACWMSVGGTVAACLALLAAVAAAFWGRSASGVDSVRHTAPGRLCEITSFGGHVQVRIDSGWDGSSGFAGARFQPATDAERALWDPAVLPVEASWSHGGIAHAVDDSSGKPVRYVVAPYGWVVGALVVWPAVFGLIVGQRRWRRRSRRRRGLCAACGYDVRVTPGRCSECGWGAGAEGEGHGSKSP